MLHKIKSEKNGKHFLVELSKTTYKDLVLQGGSHEGLFEATKEAGLGDQVLDALGARLQPPSETSKLVRRLYDHSINLTI